MANRVEREIEEILNRFEGQNGRGRTPTPLRRPLRSRLRRSAGRLRGYLPALPAFTTSNMMLTGIGLILGAMLFRMFSSTLAYWSVLIGLVLFALSFVLGFRRGGGTLRGGGGDTYWRGQRVPRAELRGPSPLDRLNRWWQRNRRRR